MENTARTQQLIMTASAMVANHKGIVAMDESIPTLHKRFEAAGIPQTEENRRTYRELLMCTAGIGEHLNAAILFEETIHQHSLGGVPFLEILTNAGIIPGIKVDQGTEALPGFSKEKVTKGLDQLAQRLADYAKQGLRFAKWRGVILIEGALPSPACILANAHALARYAADCQAAGLVPIVEPEVLMDGNHSIERCAEVTENVLHVLFEQLYLLKVDLRGLILKPNMVLPGTDGPAADVNLIAKLTVNCLRNAVPAAVAGIAFLSGGQHALAASANLNAINLNYKNELPWPVTFSFSRALHQPSLALWKGKDENVKVAQALFLQYAKVNHLAVKGEFKT